MKKKKIIIVIDVWVNDLSAEGEGFIAGLQLTDGTHIYGYDRNKIGQPQDELEDIGNKIVKEISEKLKIGVDKIRNVK